MKHLVLGTAGHIDHGKTSFVKALTGIDTDRLKEEKERGITIDIGFAHLDLPDGEVISIVDVPGHERFIRNMLAGASGIDFVALVIAADEGIMPQTKEHMRICELLGIAGGLIVLTKIDMVDEEWLALVMEDITRFLTGSFLHEAPMVLVSNRDGRGIDEARRKIIEVAQRLQPRTPQGRFRMPIDRVFTIKGFGTVVTGTVSSGEVRVGDGIEVLPLGRTVKIRGLQFHDQPADLAQAGQRIALNLQGLDKNDLHRGDYVATPGSLHYVSLLNARYRALAEAPVVRHRTRVRVHQGANEVLGRIALLDRDEVRPGETCFIQLRLESPIAAMPDDRYILRLYSPVATIGGGTVIETTTQKLRQRRTEALARLQHLAALGPTERLVYLIREKSYEGMTIQDLLNQTPSSLSGPEILLQSFLADGRLLRIEADPPLLIHREGLDELQRHLRNNLTEFHQLNSLRLGISREELRSRISPDFPPKLFQTALDQLVRDGIFSLKGSMVSLASAALRLSPEQQQLYDSIVRQYQLNSLQPPLTNILINETLNNHPEAAAMIALLLDQGILVKIGDHLNIHAEALEALRQQLISFLRQHGQITITEFKDLTGGSRKFAVPLLEYFDRAGITRRSGDARVLRS